MTASVIRPAELADLDAILALAAARRQEYAAYQPGFWRPARDAAARQAPYLSGLIADPAVISLVAGTGPVLVGYAVGQLTEAPPVYDPGGATCVVDDFAVADPALWATVGVDLLTAVTRAATDRGAAQVVVVTAARDDPKRDALDRCGLAPAAEWWVTSTAPVQGPRGGARG